jgi:glyoxylase-like metal-dependent hydrolase (beta-lactamase superfamily II)/rhodanese-related sulfurtransferase
LLFQQFVDGDLGCASYLVGDEEAGAAVVVDPPYAIEGLAEAAARHGVRIVRCIETHTHADHLSGHGRLALEHDVPISVHPAAEAEYPHDPLEDGVELEIGRVVLRAVHTPGHRPEHTCLAVSDRSRADEPWLVLTGDSLFVGDAARPDLAVAATDGAAALYGSLQRLLELPDGVEVYPGHVAGSLCGKGMSSKASSTIGFERRFNSALQLPDEPSFVVDRAAVGAPKPPNMTRLVELNRGPLVAAAAPVDELPAVPDGAAVLDVRPLREFLAAHVAGAIGVPLDGGSFATKAGFVLDPGAPIVVAAADDAQAQRAIRGLRSIGFLDVEGYVLGGGDERIEPVALDDVEGLVARGAEVLDVREREERDTGYIPGSRNVPYRLLAVGGPDVPTDRPVITICETGARAAIAASLLAARGVDARPVVDGGMADWARNGGRTVEFRRCGGTV